MPGTLSFTHSDEIIAALRTRQWEDDLKKAHPEEDLGPLTAVYSSVTRSTYRAFRKRGKCTPSLVFRSWAAEELFEGALAEFCEVKSNDQYRIWAKALARRLDKEWHESLRYRLELPRALKLVNLLAKGLCVVSPLWPSRWNTVVENIDVPLDKFSLRPLACVGGFRHLRNASMGSVKNLDEYVKIQRTIRDLCDKADVPPIAYDFLAWDGPHAKTKMTVAAGPRVLLRNPPQTD